LAFGGALGAAFGAGVFLLADPLGFAEASGLVTGAGGGASWHFCTQISEAFRHSSTHEAT